MNFSISDLIYIILLLPVVFSLVSATNMLSRNVLHWLNRLTATSVAAALFLLVTAFDPLQAFLLALMVNARHIFYGLSLLNKYKGLGGARFFMVFALCDETFSLVSTLEPPEGVARKDFYFWITLLDYLYWVGGTALGGLLGRFITFDTTGLDFALTALFVVLFLEQWKKPENRPSGLIGIGCAAVSLAVFGPDKLVIPAMALILAVLLGGRKRLCI